MMHLIYLAGNSLSNKNWIEKVKSEFDPFFSGEILYYDHWQTAEKWINLETESRKLADLVKDQKDYGVFAKSAGTVLALKNIFEKKFHPLRAIFCGLPSTRYLKSLVIPTIFIQNEFDPVCSFAELEKVLVSNPPAHYQLIKNPGNHTHDYDNFKQLVSLAKDFL